MDIREKQIAELKMQQKDLITQLVKANIALESIDLNDFCDKQECGCNHQKTEGQKWVDRYVKTESKRTREALKAATGFKWSHYADYYK